MKKKGNMEAIFYIFLCLQIFIITLACTLSLAGNWVDQGPGPTQNGQVENVNPNNEVVGAIHTLVTHPTDPDTIWVGGTNGGIWRTTNGTNASPNWVPLTDTFPSLSIGALELDPTDGTNQTLVAGIGRFSSFGSSNAGPLIGLLRTADGGNNWIQLGVVDLQGRNVTGVGPRGSTILVSTSNRGGGTNPGVYLSTDNGASFTNISGINGLPNGSVFDMVGDPGDPNRFYVGLQGGIFRTNDAGANWANITDLAMPIGGTTNNIEFAVHNNTVNSTNAVYVGIINNGQLAGFFRSDDQGDNWTAMDIPQTNEGATIVGLQPREKPGSQGAIHFSIVADPNDSNIVYVGGDRQPNPFPNFIGAQNFSGRLFRGDASVAATGAVPSPQWEHLTHSNAIAAIPGGGTASNSSPHADSREMRFDANGNIIEVDDGGIYRRTSPIDNTGDWFSINGDIQTTEFHDIAYDNNSNILIGGAQDTGTHEQSATASNVWVDIRQADGGDVAVDDTSVAGQSTRYFSTQNLNGFRRRTCDAFNVCGANTIIGLNVTGNPLNAQFVTPIELNVTDQTRLIIGGSNSVYESFDQGDNIAEITGPGANRNAMVYGHLNNADLIVIGSGAGIFIRTTAGGNLLQTTTAFPGSTVRDIVVDPSDENSFYVTDSSDQVFQTTDGGSVWNNITGDIPRGNTAENGRGNFRSITYVEDLQDRVVVGTNSGVYFTAELSLGTWFKLGDQLPNAPVWDLDYDMLTDTLVAGTLGRSAWILPTVTNENLPPVALCMDVTVPTEPGVCQADASIDDGSFDPEGGPIILTQDPPGPYPLGNTLVTLTVTDSLGFATTCQATVTVEDIEPPEVQCNAPAMIIPPDAPITFMATATDNCSVSSVVINDFDCFKFTKKGKRIDKTESCAVLVEGDKITILDTGGVDDHITWSITATDGSGNETTSACEVIVENPGNGS